MTDFTRREILKTFLGVTAATAGSILLSGCGHIEDPYALNKPVVPQDKGWYKGKEKLVSTTCAQCNAGCGIKVRVVEGRAVKIEGNEDYPINRGGLGPKGQTGVEVLYDPDRIKKPLKRTGNRGEGKWQEISWEDAAKEVASNLNKLRESNNAHQLAVICGRPRGLMVDIWKRFCRVYGTPNFFDSFSTSDGAMFQAMRLMLGQDDLPGNDWKNTRFILSLGSALFESTCQGIYFSRLSSTIKKEDPTKRAKVIHIGPVETLTAKQADEWISIRPGTYDALILGIINVLVTEDLYDTDFVKSHTFGFEQWKDKDGKVHKGFQDIIKEYTPEKTEELTGVSANDIKRIAHQMAKYRPSVAIVDSRSTSSSNGLEIAIAALALNGILGSINTTGGLIVQSQPPYTKWPEAKLDKAAQNSIKQPRMDLAGADRFPFLSSVTEALPEQIIQDKPYPIQSLFLYYSNPLFSKINFSRYKQAFDKIPFIVSFSPLMDESAYYSDLILPDHTYLERYEDAPPNPSVGYPLAGIRQPAVLPLYETKHTGDFLLELTKQLGETISGNFPWEDFKEVLKYSLKGIFKSNKGSLKADSEKEFFKSLNKAGFWEDPKAPVISWEIYFKTPSNKFEFFSTIAQTKIQNMAKTKNIPATELLKSWGKTEDLDLACLPHSSLPDWNGDDKMFPFQLLLYKPITYAEGSGANLPWLNLLDRLHDGVHKGLWVALHSKTARKLGIKNKDGVTITSPTGKIKAYAKIVNNIPHDTVLMSLKYGHSQMGRFAPKTDNPRNLIAAKLNLWSGITPLLSTKVSITKG